jgi:hypothetical protein
MLKAILFALMLIGAAGIFYRLNRDEAFVPLTEDGGLLPHPDFSQESPLPLDIPDRPIPPYRKETEPGLFVTPENRPALSGRLLNRALPLVFSETEGSYTDLGGLFQSKAPAGVDLRSEWVAPYLFPDRNLPSLRLRVLQDPATGEFRLSGGSVALPGSSFEAGYETDLNREEQRGILQWRKSF